VDRRGVQVESKRMSKAVLLMAVIVFPLGVNLIGSDYDKFLIICLWWKWASSGANFECGEHSVIVDLFIDFVLITYNLIM
jgi:hypothetical protein